MDRENRLEHPEAIAVVGMSGVFPGARDVDQFWQNLREGRESISFLSNEELLDAGVSQREITDPNYVRARGILPAIDRFDAEFFGISPREAEFMDPQHRFFLEHAWNALESAGHSPGSFEGRIGVYAGVGENRYLFDIVAGGGAHPELADLGNDKDYLATRVSYKLGLRGPGVTIQTACSTSLVACHLAIQGLLTYQCDMALAGGVAIKIPHTVGHLYREGGILSPDGHCRAFDARAKGIVVGNGLGIVVLRRLSEAIEDRDTILAVIRGSAINNDGADKVGYTAPSLNGQAEVIAGALAIAGVEPQTVTYVEAHGTATPLGDPIEVGALTQAFRSRTDKRHFCALGSVKTNIGHLDTAAGIAGLIKVVLCLRNKEIPPSLHFERANPAIHFENSPFFVNSELIPWKTDETPRRAGVSSFGIGGTNAHFVLEEAPEAEKDGVDSGPQLLILSAKTESALDSRVKELAVHLADHPETELADAAFTLQAGRKSLTHRRSAICTNRTDALRLLRDPAAPEWAHGLVEEGWHRPVAFLFPGEGAQYPNMGRDLYESVRAFRQSMDRSCELLRAELHVDLREVLFPGAGGMEASSERLQQTNFAEPALFVVELALAELLKGCGVVPDCMIGHGVGELTAACLAGVFSVEDALRLVAARGRLMQAVPRGAMLSVELSEREVQGYLSRELTVASSNAPDRCVVAGPEADVGRLEARLAQEGIVRARRLRTSHAFHSPMMIPAMEAFADVVRRISRRPPSLRYVSNVTGTWITAKQSMDPAHWATHLLRTVRFSEGMGEILRIPSVALLELGPGTALTGLAQRQPQSGGTRVISSMRQALDPAPDRNVFLEAVGRLWLGGVAVDWKGLHGAALRRRVVLPVYPFERRSHWFRPRPVDTRVPAEVEPPTSQLDAWFHVPYWKPSGVVALPRELRKKRWLILADGSDFCNRLATELERAGAVVSLERDIDCLSSQRESDPPSGAIGQRASRTGRGQAESVLDGIVDARGLSSSEPLAAADGATNEVWRLLSLVTSLWRNGHRNAIELVLLGNRLHAVRGAEEVVPARASVLGACRVIPQEHSNLRCRSIDIGLSVQAEWPLQLFVRDLLGEADDPVVAYRGGARWVQAFEPVRVESPEGLSTGLFPEGVYVITGGLGGIGRALAEHLAETCRARLFLIGRSKLPPRKDWEAFLDRCGEDDVTAEKLRAIQRMEAHGARVETATVDVADPDALARALEDCRRTLGRIDGVIHSAGVAGGRVIQSSSRNETNAVMAPKVDGARSLAACLRADPPRFVVLFSSLAAFTGGFGQAAYAAANAFLDAFADSHGASETFVSSINWDTWSEVGMAVDRRLPQQLVAEREEALRRGIRTHLGVQAFRRILAHRLRRVVVTTQDFPRRGIVLATPRRSRKENESNSERMGGPVEARDGESLLARIWKEVLGVEEIHADETFLDLGGDSLMVLDVVARLKAGTRAQVGPRDLLFNTFGQLSERLAEVDREPV